MEAPLGTSVADLVAALGFANPVLAGAAMAFSSLFVGNSLRRRSVRPLRS